jgi:hypothetical protein
MTVENRRVRCGVLQLQWELQLCEQCSVKSEHAATAGTAVNTAAM